MVDEKRIAQLLDKWEAGETLSEMELEELRAASGEAASHRRLLYFVQRDSGATATKASPAAVSPQFTTGVMERITAERRQWRFPARPAVAAVAAVALLLLGTVGGLLVGRSSVAPNRVVVQFQLAAPGADSVTLVGDFSDWEADRYRLRDEDDDGVWEITVPLRSGQVYTYNFLINGETWVTDPDSLTTVDDGFGGEKSVLNL
jgi:hypothetical protein